MNALVQQNYLRSLNLDDGWIGRGGMQNAIDPLSFATMPGISDGYSPAYPPYPGSANSQQGGFFAQIMQMLQSLMGMLGQLVPAQPGAGSQTPFSNATISSTGDPHLAIDGTLSDGSSVSMKYDNMQSDPDFVRSNSFFGGYHVSTQTTAPTANGVTMNQSATVTTCFGQNQVTFDKDGNATVAQNGNVTALSSGQTLNLGNGETVTDNGNSLVVADTNGGGSITTTMTQNGAGIDVTVNAQNVDLGGDVVKSALGGAKPFRSTS
jgi:hypothetical protein